MLRVPKVLKVGKELKVYKVYRELLVELEHKVLKDL